MTTFHEDLRKWYNEVAMKISSAGGWQWLIALLATTIFFLLFLPKSVAKTEIIPLTAERPAIVVLPVASPPAVPKILSDIGWCESKNDQTKVGYNYRLKTVTDANGAMSTVKVLWSRDIGKYQINDYYHSARSKALGFDIYTEAGNTAYALLLYNENGTRDWNPSKPCWSDIEAWKAKHQSFY